MCYDLPVTSTVGKVTDTAASDGDPHPGSSWEEKLNFRERMVKRTISSFPSELTDLLDSIHGPQVKKPFTSNFL